MKSHTKERLAVIATEIRAAAFMAQKSKSPREHFNAIHTLAKEACDYFAFGFDATPPPAKAEPEAEVYGFTCPVADCFHNDSEFDVPDYVTMREALDAADQHRIEHHTGATGIVTFEAARDAS